MPNKYDNQHLRNVHKYADDVARLYDEAVLSAARLLMGANYDPKGFKFTDHPQIKSSFNKFFNSFNNSLGSVIRNGMRQEWALSNGKNDALVESLIGDDHSKYKNYFSSNGPAMDAFLNRQRDGLKLSDRVWNLTRDFKDRLESGVNSGIGGGRGARLIAKDMMDYLQTPAEVGPGVYSDPKKNAQRLTRTETNMAYHASDWERWNQLDFVIGFEVEVSNNGNVCPLCQQLAGKYPKWFKFVGWHPMCYCHATAILAEDIDAPAGDPETVTQVPKGFSQWVADNQERSIGKKQPYFVRDNFKGGKVTGGLLKPESMPKVKTKADPYTDNLKEVAKKVGVAQGKPMSFDEANALKGNINYGKNDSYSVNCQSCVVANELRRRGFDVTAMPNMKNGDIPHQLSRKTQWAWIDPATNAIPKKTVIGIGSRSFGQLSSALTKENLPTGRYHMDFVNKGGRTGHIVTFEKMESGKYRFYDPQNGKEIKWASYKGDMSVKWGVQVLRVDDKLINTEIIDGIVKKL